MVPTGLKLLLSTFSRPCGFEAGGRDVFKLLAIKNETDLHSDSTKRTI